MAKVIWHKNAIIRVLRIRTNIGLTTTNPRLGTVNEKLTAAYGCEIRNITVFKHFKLIYIIETEGHQDETVRILDLWDTRAKILDSKLLSPRD